MAFIGKHFFSIIICILLLLLLCASFYRFVLLEDYLVSYEIACDPSTESCFIGCEDESCDDIYYYSIMERQAAEINALCGPNILECEAAQLCQENVEYCDIRYCDATTGDEECSDLNNTL